ncbi:MAG: hypothetical protein U0R26_00295 [Solirubrobacterales bacterium]
MRRKEPPQPRPLASSAAERIGAIIEAVERAAESVIDDAEAQARTYLSEAQAAADLIVSERASSLMELTDSLMDQAEAIRRQSERLLESLAEVKARLAAAPGPEPTLRGTHLSAVAPAPEPEARPPAPGPRTQGEDRPTPAGARLLATQMAVSGSSREEIDFRLRSGFEIEDTTAILDAILGPED